MADPHVVTALCEKYARMSGELRSLNRYVEKLRRDIAHVEATIRLFKRDWQRDHTVPIKPGKPSRWGGRGQGLRLATDVLREAGEPLTAREIASRALAKRGIELPDSRTLTAVADSLARSLERRLGQGVIRIEGKPLRWGLAGQY